MGQSCATVHPLPLPPHADTADNTRLSFRQKISIAILILFLSSPFLAIVIISFTTDCYEVTQLTNEEYSVVSLAVSSFNVSTSPSKLSAEFDLTLSSSDTIKLGDVDYDRVAASIIYRAAGITLAQGPLPSFHHYFGGTVHGRVTVAGKYLLPDVAQAITRNLNEVPRALVLDVNVTSRMTSTTAGLGYLMLHCKEVTVWFNTTDAGSTLGTPKSCDIIESLIDL